MGPKISIIIPVYNTQNYLKECLDSVISQTLKDIEIICIDDGSTDSSIGILKTYRKKDFRIKIIKQKNKGAAKSRNYAIQIAKGEFVCFLDSDDKYPSADILEKLYINAKENNVYICGGEFSSFTNENSDLTQNYSYSQNGYLFDRNEIVDYKDYQFDYGYHRFIYNRNLLLENKIFFENLKRFEDPPFMVKAFLAAKKFYCIDQISYAYRRSHKKVISSKKLVEDCLTGILENLQIAGKNKLNKLLEYTSIRFSQHIDEYITNNISIKSYILLMKIKKLVIKNDKIKKFYIHLNIYQIIKPTITSLFSVANDNRLHKVITCLGIKIKIKKQKQNIIDLAMILDENYLLCTLVALQSMKKNKKKNSIYNINIIVNKLSKNNIQLLKQIESKNFTINIINVNYEKFNSFSQVFHITNTSLIKFELPNILSGIDKVLYIDSDTLITQDLFQLFNVDIKNYYIAAIRELRAEKKGFHKLVNQIHYFNSGVMLMNLKKMRENDISAKLLIAKKNQPSNWTCMDQDVFNNICGGETLYLDCKYNNTCTIFLDSDIQIDEINGFYHTKYKSWSDFVKKSVIIHFAGPSKPWLYNIHIVSKLYFGYLKKGLVPYTYRLKYAKLLSRKNFKLTNILRTIFAVQNDNRKEHKIITLLGVKIKLKRKVNQMSLTGCS